MPLIHANIDDQQRSTANSNNRNQILLEPMNKIVVEQRRRQSNAFIRNDSVGGRRRMSSLAIAFLALLSSSIAIKQSDAAGKQHELILFKIASNDDDRMFLPATLFRPMSRWVSPFYENDGGLVGVKFGVAPHRLVMPTDRIGEMALDGASFVSLPESDDDEAIVENRKGVQPPQSFARISRANRYVSLEQLNSENGEIGSGADENARWRRGGGRFGSAGGAGGGKSYYDHIRFGRR